MAKEKSTDKSDLSKEERRTLKQAKKDKKEAKSQLLVADAGVSKPKSDKKDKKEKTAKREALAEKALNEISQKPDKKEESSVDEEAEEGGEREETDVEEDEEKVVKGKANGKKETPVSKMLSRPVGALVPFANPLVEEKVAKKVFKGVKKAAANRTLKRGVKEVVKAIRRSPTTPSTTGSEPTGVVVLAADISPMDVISHIPVLCEDHHIPYVYVTSRAELGMAGQTKRPTSVVMVGRELGKKKDGQQEDGEDWAETYKGLVKVVEREGKNVRV